MQRRLLQLNSDFKSKNPSKPRTRAHVEPKSGLVLIRPMIDWLESILSAVDRSAVKRDVIYTIIGG